MARPSFTYVLCVSMQIYSSRDLEDNLNKIREICSDDKHDWDQRANAVSRFTFNAFPFLSSINEITFFGAASFDHCCRL